MEKVLNLNDEESTARVLAIDVATLKDNEEISTLIDEMISILNESIDGYKVYVLIASEDTYTTQGEEGYVAITFKDDIVETLGN